MPPRKYQPGAQKRQKRKQQQNEAKRARTEPDSPPAGTLALLGGEDGVSTDLTASELAAPSTSTSASEDRCRALSPSFVSCESAQPCASSLAALTSTHGSKSESESGSESEFGSESESGSESAQRRASSLADSSTHGSYSESEAVSEPAQRGGLIPRQEHFVVHRCRPSLRPTLRGWVLPVQAPVELPAGPSPSGPRPRSALSSSPSPLLPSGSPRPRPRTVPPAECPSNIGGRGSLREPNHGEAKPQQVRKRGSMRCFTICPLHFSFGGPEGR